MCSTSLGKYVNWYLPLFLLPIWQRLPFIATGYFHTPHIGGRLSPQINTRSCISLNICPGEGVRLLVLCVSGCSLGAATCQLQMTRPLWLSACCLSPPVTWMNARWRLKFCSLLHTRWFTFTIWCLCPSAPHRLSLPVTAASLAGWALSSGGAPMEERGTDMQPLGLQWRDVIGSSGNKGIFFAVKPVTVKHNRLKKVTHSVFLVDI